MIVYAAIDLRAGRVVQLVGGSPEEERVSLPDAAAVARDWVRLGFTALHVVDLDAALVAEQRGQQHGGKRLRVGELGGDQREAACRGEPGRSGTHRLRCRLPRRADRLPRP